MPIHFYKTYSSMEQELLQNDKLNAAFPSTAEEGAIPVAGRDGSFIGTTAGEPKAKSLAATESVTGASLIGGACVVSNTQTGNTGELDPDDGITFNSITVDPSVFNGLVNTILPISGVNPPVTGARSRVAGEVLADFVVVYSDSSDSGKVKKARNNADPLQADAIGIVLVGGATNESVTVVTKGPIYNSEWAWTPHLGVWVGDVAGTLTQTSPTSGSVKYVGVALEQCIIDVDPQTGYTL